MPDCQALQHYQNSCITIRKNNNPTLPTTIEKELAINPFLRLNDPMVVNALKARFKIDVNEKQSTAKKFEMLRYWKDKF